MPNSNNGSSKKNVPDNYTNRGAKTPTYPAPPMPKTVPAKPSNPKKSK